MWPGAYGLQAEILSDKILLCFARALGEYAEQNGTAPDGNGLVAGFFKVTS